ncbi:MAG: small, acid-soluble spore protein, alpha/beta type [Ruminococcaceae bacterium]|nr:small, acid-soluble spore protein, alpha/beta type [Oscillospiraceae bacterium]
MTALQRMCLRHSIKIQGDFIMNNKRLVPEAKEAMDKFKMEAASDEDVTDTY